MTQHSPPSEARPARRSARAHLTRIAGLLAPYKGRWVLATLTLALAGGVNLGLPKIAETAIDDAVKKGDTALLDLIIALAFGGFALLGILTFIRHYLMTWLGNRVVADLRDQCFRHLMTHPPGYFHERKTGALVSRLTSDIGALQHTVGSELSIALRSTLITIGALTIAFITSPELTAMMLLVVPPLSVLAVWAGRRIRRRARRMQDLVAEANSGLKESLGGIETVQTFTAEEAEAQRYAGHVYGAFDASLGIAVARGGFMGAVQFAAFGAITLILWFGVSDVMAGTMTEGQLLSFVVYTGMVATSLASLANIWGNLQKAIGASERIFQLLDETPAITSPPNAVALPRPKGALAFEDVTFAYPGRRDVTVLHDVSFRAEPGDIIALVGRSGAGKSTIAALVHRFYDPTGGRVTLDGHDLRTLELSDLRHAIGTVAQDPVLFSGSIGDNIAYGAPDASPEDIAAAAADAHIASFIEDLPAGYGTLVGERGVKLSGGQRQRVAIARAILADPRILILDEATSHLDSENEALVHAALSRLMRGRTTLIIAHRLSTVQSATRILVMDKGRVVESGSHDDLLARDALYTKLTATQLINA